MKKTIFLGFAALLVSAAVNAQTDTTQKRDTTITKDTSATGDSSQAHAMLHAIQHTTQYAVFTVNPMEFTERNLPEALRVKAIAQKSPFVQPKEA